MSRYFVIPIVIFLAATAGQAKDSPFNVDFTIGWEGCFRPMEWTSVDVGVSSSLKKPFGGVLTVSARQDDMTEMVISHPFVLTPDLPLQIPLVTKIAFAADECDLMIRNEKGRVAWKKKYELWQHQSASSLITVIQQTDMLIGLVGRRGFALSQLAEHTTSRTDRGSGDVYLKQKLPRLLPWDWTGYRSLDLLILYDVDWNQINRHQAKAIGQWVTNGGRLLIVLGGRAIPADHPLAGFIPFEISEPVQATLPAAKLGEWGCPASDTQLPLWQLKARPDTQRPFFEQFGTGGPAFASAMRGFGCVGVLGFDPSKLPSPNPKAAAKFWADRFGRILSASGSVRDDLGRRRIEIERDESNSDDGYSFDTGRAQVASAAVLNHLLSIPELRPLSIWWVIGLLVLLAVLLGPVDYLVLKKLDRQPLTWLTSAAVIIIFTAGAYYGVQALRSGRLQVRVVSLVDAVDGQPGAWNTTYAGIFAPKSDEYRLTGLSSDQWWSGISPMEDRLYIWRERVAGRKIYCVQRDGGNLPTGLPINIWSMQCLLRESPSQPPPLEVSLQRDGDEVVLEIRNRSERDILKGTVRIDGDKMMKFGSVPAGQQKEFRGKLRSTIGWGKQHFNEYSNSRFREAAYFAEGSLRRTRAMQEYMDLGAGVVCVEYDQAPISFAVKDKEFTTDHIRLVRLVVFPNKDEEDD